MRAFILTVLSAGTAFAQLTWSKNTIGPPVSSPNYLVIAPTGGGDMDGDGDVDLISIRGFAGNSGYYLRQDAGFTFTAIALPSAGAYGFDVADIDGDGDLDFFSAGWNGTNLGLENDGAGGWTVRSLAGFSIEDHIAAGDLDLDGDIDAAVTGSGHRTFWLRNNGFWNFSAVNIEGPTSGNENEGVRLLDMDLDGDLDILVASWGATPFIKWYENDGSASFTPQSITTGSGWHDAGFGDFDCDGDWDVTAVNNSSNILAIFENLGAGWFQRNIGNVTYGSEVDGYDVDMDGDWDIVATGGRSYNATGEVSVFYNDGAWGFTEQNVQTTGSYGSWASDINGDGCTDIFNSEYSGGQTTPVVYLGAGCGTTPPCDPVAVGTGEESGRTQWLRVSLVGGRLSTSSSSTIDLFELYDVSGRMALRLEPGTKSFSLDFARPVGVYFYRAVLQGGTESGKLLQR